VPLPVSTGVLAFIAARVGDMRKSEQRVAAVILDDPGAALNMSMARLAAAAKVSDPTVMRFCAAVGYDGYQTFRLALAQSLAFGVPATNSAIVRDDSSEVIIDKIFAYTLSSLDHTRRTLDVKPVVQAIDLMFSARELVFIGHGASHIIAQDAAQKFPLFGVACSAPADSHQQHMMASMATEGVVVTLISNTGHTASILDLARLSKAQGASVIGITGAASPLAEIADVALIVETLENTDLFTPTISRIAALVLIDVLSTGVALLRSDSHVSRMQQMKASLAELRSGRL
jgi:RpiR family transcriptional regulator, carbohydrate utilization regulator